MEKMDNYVFKEIDLLNSLPITVNGVGVGIEEIVTPTQTKIKTVSLYIKGSMFGENVSRWQSEKPHKLFVKDIKKLIKGDSDICYGRLENNKEFISYLVKKLNENDIKIYSDDNSLNKNIVMHQDMALLKICKFLDTDVSTYGVSDETDIIDEEVHNDLEEITSLEEVDVKEENELYSENLF